METENVYQSNEDGLSLKDIFYIVKKNIIMILVFIFVAIGIGGIYNYKIQAPIYRSSAQVMIAATDPDSGTTQAQQYSLSNYLINTFVDFFKSEVVLDQAKESDSLSNTTLTNKAIKANLKVTKGNDSLIINLSYTSTNQKEASVILQAVLDAAKIQADEVIGNDVHLMKNKIVILSNATPATRVSKTMMNLALSFVVGVVIAFLYVLIKNSFDDTFKSKKDIEVVLDLPVIASIPLYEIKEDKNNENC